MSRTRIRDVHHNVLRDLYPRTEFRLPLGRAFAFSRKVEWQYCQTSNSDHVLLLSTGTWIHAECAPLGFGFDDLFCSRYHECFQACLTCPGIEWLRYTEKW